MKKKSIRVYRGCGRTNVLDKQAEGNSLCKSERNMRDKIFQSEVQFVKNLDFAYAIT